MPFDRQKLREAREANEHRDAIPVEAVALAARVSRNTVYNWEAGKSKPDADQLEAIAEATGLPLDFFYVPGAA